MNQKIHIIPNIPKLGYVYILKPEKGKNCVA